MKTLRIYLLAGLSVAVVGLKAQAATINTGQNPDSPFYADLRSTSLNVFYSYSGSVGPNATGTGNLSVFNPYSISSLVLKDQTYDAPGGGNALQSFLGGYEINATIAVANGVASLSGGTVKVYGAGGIGDLLLQGSLRTGLGGVAFGYEDYAGAGTPAAGKYDLFQFVFDVTGGKPTYVADYMGIGGTGAIILDANFDYTPTTYLANNGSKTTTGNEFPQSTTYRGFNGDWARNFANPQNTGYADTFVPEPAAYAGFGAGLALAAVILGRRKSVVLQSGSN